MALEDRGTWKNSLRDESGKLRGALLMWLIGIPLPIILLIYLFKGCV